VFATGGANYFKDGPVTASEKQKFEALFGNGNLNASIGGGNLYHTDANNAIDRFYVTISNINNIGKPGVLYTFQRAESDELGNVVGTYGDISVYGSQGGTTALGTTT
jgi:hypothetical protein